jgi:hypothetical protein
MKATNPWNEVYKIAAGKKKGSTVMTTLMKEDGTLTENLENNGITD